MARPRSQLIHATSDFFGMSAMSMATAALGLDKVHGFLRGRECECAGSPVFSYDNPGIVPIRYVPFIMRPQALAALFPRHAHLLTQDDKRSGKL